MATKNIIDIRENSTEEVENGTENADDIRHCVKSTHGMVHQQKKRNMLVIMTQKHILLPFVLIPIYYASSKFHFLLPFHLCPVLHKLMESIAACDQALQAAIVLTAPNYKGIVLCSFPPQMLSYRS